MKMKHKIKFYDITAEKFINKHRLMDIGFRWHKTFLNDWNIVENKLDSDQLVTWWTEENAIKLTTCIRSDWCLIEWFQMN